MSRYQMTDTAWADIEELREFVAARNLSAAEQLVDDLFGSFAEPGEHPHLG